LCYTYESGSKVFEATFALGCLTPNHIQVYIEGDVDGLGEQNYLYFTYDSVTETVTVTSDITIPTGETDVTVVVQRTVPKDELYISFGGGADVTRSNIDGMITYTLMALHEVLDGRWDISFDWEELNAAYRSLYTLLDGGDQGDVLTKVTDTDFDIGWAPVGVLPILDNHTSAATSTSASTAWKKSIVILPDNCVTVTFSVNAEWQAGDEFILIGKQFWTLHLDTGVSLAGTSYSNTDLAVAPYPSGIMCRYTGDNKWLFIGDAALL
jgi:hypothetical protein